MEASSLPEKLLSVTSAAGLVCMLLAGAGYKFMISMKNDNPLAPYALQIIGLCFILPVVLLISITAGLGKDAITGLLGTIIGYIFGSAGKPKFPKAADRPKARASGPTLPEVTASNAEQGTRTVGS